MAYPDLTESGFMGNPIGIKRVKPTFCDPPISSRGPKGQSSLIICHLSFETYCKHCMDWPLCRGPPWSSGAV